MTGSDLDGIDRKGIDRIGIDIEQFMRDPYGTGIQRVLQYLAIQWPADLAADFLVPAGDGLLRRLTPQQAAELISVPFAAHPPEVDLRGAVDAQVDALDAPVIAVADLPDAYGAWLLPEVSYLPAVLERFEAARRTMRTAMIGYDTLPMTEPANYRFKPGLAAWVSEYFRMLAVADDVACISAYARDSILGRLRRDPALPIRVAHPGGDHIAIREGAPPQRPRFCRVGTMEARKRPVEILQGFIRAVDAGLDAELRFVGRRSPSNAAINATIDDAIAAGYPVTWVEGASDAEVVELIRSSSVFLSIGIEGYGIPVLEAIRVGTPVVYDGIQPAGEVMQGRGAMRIAAGTEAEMTAMFGGAVQHLDRLRAELDPEGVPTWQAFAADVAAAVSAR